MEEVEEIAVTPCTRPRQTESNSNTWAAGISNVDAQIATDA